MVTGSFNVLLGADRITAPPFHWCEANAATHIAQAKTHTFHDPTGWLEQINMPDAQRVRLLQVTRGDRP